MSSSSGSDDGGVAPAAADLREWDEWDDDPEEDDAARSLFSDAVLPSPEACFAHDAECHGFDIRRFRAQLGLDDYGTIRAINWIRHEVAGGRDPLPALRAAADAGAGSAGAWPWAGDEFLAPALEDDPLLGYDYDDTAADEGWQAAAAAGAAALTLADASAAGPSTSAAAGVAAAVDPDAAAALRAENAALRTRIAALMEAALPEELRGGGGSGGAAGPSGRGGSSSGSSSSGSGGSDDDEGGAAGGRRGGRGVVIPGRCGGGGGHSLGANAAAAGGAEHKGEEGAGAGGEGGGKGRRDPAQSIDAAYFESYSYFDIHREMLGDKARTDAYRDALERNPGLLHGARVLDVGCGTGILSMFAARGGAAAVVGLDGSERIAGFARQIVAANGLAHDQGGPVAVVSGRVEQGPDIGMDQVDVIVSEWMGYVLLFETMLDSVLAARDRWLRPGGAVLPDIATIHVAGAGDDALGLDFWKDVYGFKMAPVADELWRGAAGKVTVREVDAASLVTAPARLHHMDIATMAPRDQDFTTEVLLAANAAAEGGVRCSCVVLWFDVEFSSRFCKEAPVVLTTSPAAPQTHWMQAVLPLKAPLELPAGSGLACRVSMARSHTRHRTLDVALEYGVVADAAAASAAAAAGGGAGVGAGVSGALKEAVSFCMTVGGE